MTEELCHCGKPLHYANAEARRIVDMLVKAYGSNVLVRKGGHAWRVPRHYIALHGLKAEELPFLGFEEVLIAEEL